MESFKKGDIVYRISHTENLGHIGMEYYRTKTVRVLICYGYSFRGLDTTTENDWGYYTKDFIKLNENQVKLWRLINV